MHRHPTFHSLRVADVERLTDDAVAITFEIPDGLGDAFCYAPGQHVTIRWWDGGQELRRNYSICSSVASGVLRVAVKALPGGTFSRYATTELRAGDELEVMTPTGRFSVRLDPGRARHYAAVAAGSGITPVLSILASVLDCEPRSRATLLYGNRTTSSIMFLEDLQDLKNRFPDRFALLNVLSREPQDVELLHGRIDRGRIGALLSSVLPPQVVDEWFLCGPFAMVEEARATLLDHSVDRGHIHLELFHPAGEAPRHAAEPRETLAKGASAVTIILDGRAATFDLARDGEVVLDAALRVRGDAPYACKGAICGTCRAKVVHGEVRMDRNHALEQGELDDGVVLTCQSHPVSEVVRLDYDI
ncbi:MAG: 1,2-phenylacetyl-CoA epoxidase subunit PaaE [Carbonactinosporaceae bacterium]